MNSKYDILFKNHDPDEGIIKKSKVSHNQIKHGYAYLTHLPRLSIVTTMKNGVARPRETVGDGFWTVVPFSSKLTGRGYCP